MPRPPQITPTAASVAGAVYSGVAARVDPTHDDYFPLHVGDHTRRPPAGCALGELEPRAADHQYTATPGLPDLRAALAERANSLTGSRVTAEEVLVTASATAGLHAAVETLVSPDEEVLLLAPYWPLIEGMIRSRGGVPVVVDTQGTRGARELRDAIDEAVGERSVALYFASPGNPTGRLFDESELDVLADAARRHDLWLIGDDVYDRYCFSRGHASAIGRAPERTLVAYSASKTYAMSGNRCGWLVGPRDILDAVHRVGTHTWYSAPTLAQRALLRALDRGESWLQEARDDAADLAQRCADLLGIAPPDGGTFLWVDVSTALDERGLQGLLEDAADRGLLVAPGPSFGPYPDHVRLCFTCASPEITLRGTAVLADLLGRTSGERS